MTKTRQRVLVTGASKGIGRAIMTRLLAEGYEPVGLARTRPSDAAEGEVFHQVDLSDLQATRETVAGLSSEAPFYGLINNAAMAPTTSLTDCSIQDMEDSYLLNMTSPLVCTQAVLEGMKSLGAGRIINLSSRASLGKAGRTAYSAAKAGILGMTRTWALELAAAGITVNAIAPGPIATELFRKSSPPDHPSTQALMASVPVQRVGEPEEIAHAVAYLLDRRAGFTTGQTLYIDGGLTISAVRV